MKGCYPLCLLPPQAARIRDTGHYPAVTTHPTRPGPRGLQPRLWTPRSHPGGTIHPVLIRLRGFEQRRQRQLRRTAGGTAREPGLPAPPTTKILCQGYKEGKDIELFWKRSGVLKLLFQNCFLVKTSPQRGKPTGFHLRTSPA